jgi:transcriptional regulator with XRE-family HTH domain
MIDRTASFAKFKMEFCERIALARSHKHWTQQQMADALGIELSAYQKYEKRSLLPHDLVYRFCLICDIELDWLFTGRSHLPLPRQNPEPVRQPTPAPQPRRRSSPRSGPSDT